MVSKTHLFTGLWQNVKIQNIKAIQTKVLDPCTIIAIISLPSSHIPKFNFSYSHIFFSSFLILTETNFDKNREHLKLSILSLLPMLTLAYKLFADHLMT